MKLSRSRILAAGIVTAGVLLLLPWGLVIIGAEPPAAEMSRKPSTYAPAKDLEAQVTFFLDRINEDLADEAKYDETGVERVKRDANTLAVLALVLGKHDEGNRYQGSAEAMLAEALQLAAKSANFAEAKTAFAKLNETLQKETGNSPPANLTWKPVGDIVELMNQVPKLNTALRGGVTGSAERFEKSRDKGAGLAASIAAIAQISVLDDSYCTSDADRADWIELSGLMRDAAYTVNQAIRRGDQAAAREGLKPLARTCDDCHEQFKD